MTNFLEKLKKGMDQTNSSSQENEEEMEKTESPKRKLTKSSLKKRESKKKEKFIERKPERVITIEKESAPVFSQIPISKKEWFEPEGQLTVDVYQTDKEIVVRSAIAGVKPEDLDISIENDVLLIKGKREEPKEEKAKDYYYQECYWGKFSREIVLPEEVDSTKVEATMKNGILRVRIPKINKGKKISVSQE